MVVLLYLFTSVRMWLAWCEAVIKGRPGAITGIALSQEAHLSCARADELHTHTTHTLHTNTHTHTHTQSPWDIPTVLHFTFQSSDSMSAFIWSYSRFTKIQMTPLVWKACLFLRDAVHHFEKKKSVIILQMVKANRQINPWLHYSFSIDPLVNEFLNFLFF